MHPTSLWQEPALGYALAHCCLWVAALAQAGRLGRTHAQAQAMWYPAGPGAQCCHPAEPSQRRGQRSSRSWEAGARCEWRCWARRPVGRTAWSSWKSVCSVLWVLEHIFHSKPGTGYCAKPPITKYPHMRQVTETAETTIGGTASYLLRDLLV